MSAAPKHAAGLLSISGDGAARRRHQIVRSSWGDAMKADAKNPDARNPDAKDLAERILARFGAVAALILIGAVVFYGR
jgi:hypothetical protein